MTLLRLAPALAVALLLASPAGAQDAALAGPVALPEPVLADASARGGLQITHSNSLDITGGGVACAQSSSGTTSANSYWRVFDLASFNLSGAISVESALVGVGPITPSTASVPTTLRLHRLNGPLSTSNLTLVAEVNRTVNTPSQVVNIPISGNFGPTDVMVVEWTTADGRPPAENTFDIRYGYNSAGQTGPTYISAAACGISQPTDVATLGNFGQLHWVLAVNASLATSAEGGPGGERITLGLPAPNPVAGETLAPVYLREAGHARVSVYDVLGREVVVAASGAFAAGDHLVRVDVSALPAGTYVLRVAAEGTVRSRTITVAR
ncbi:MAG: T9SS type A sorting domain-containing protein [Rubricoccaceae bacterium]